MNHLIFITNVTFLAALIIVVKQSVSSRVLEANLIGINVTFECINSNVHLNSTLGIGQIGAERALLARRGHNLWC